MAAAVALLLGFDVRAAEVSVETAKDALARATDFIRSISTHGGYVGKYSLDLTQRYGNAKRLSQSPTEIWVQQPGTPIVGRCFIRAARATGDDAYLAAAQEAALALAWAQHSNGGWSRLADVGHFRADAPEQPVRLDGPSTLDDSTTQTALQFLIELDKLVDRPWLTAAVESALDFLLVSQYPNGAWPQEYPLSGSYRDFYTFNDQAINKAISVLLAAYDAYRRPEHLQAALKGADFILASQLPEPQAGWAEQYDLTGKPARARRWELPAVSTRATARNIETLVEVYRATGEEKYRAAIPAAVAWLETSRLAPDLWAAYYEIGTNRPVYSDASGRVIYSYEDAMQSSKAKYPWHHDFRVDRALEQFEKLSRLDRKAARDDGEPDGADFAKRAARLRGPAARAIETLDGQGRWVDEDRFIRIERFVDNCRAIVAYLAASSGRRAKGAE